MAAISENIPTWYELKKLCNTLTGEQLGQSVEIITVDGNEEFLEQIVINKGKITCYNGSEPQN